VPSTTTCGALSVAPRQISVVGIDDQTAFRLGLAVVLEEFCVVGMYASTEELLTARPDADVVVLDLHLADFNRHLLQGAAAVDAVNSAGYHVLLYSSEIQIAKLVGCLRVGARGIVHKNDSKEALVEAVRTVAAGGFVVTATLAGLAELLQRQGGLPELTPRERVVLRGLARGKTYLQIAAEEHLSHRTIGQQGGSAVAKFASILKTRSARELAGMLGLNPGDLLDWDPSPKMP
jgi:DNA-binding NarL/FixJ family response regulator